jgi:sec-independent protein translocase protein TatB
MDSFFGIGLFELVMIAVIALLVLGPERLPGAMREVAKYMRQLRNISNEFQSQFSDELKMLDEINPRRILNEAIDPNAAANNLANNAAKPPATASATAATKPAAPKPAAVTTTAPAGTKSAAAGTAVATTTAAAKPLTPKPVTPSTAPSGPAITNGEPDNTILPPDKTPAAADPSAGELPAASLPPAGAPPPADVELPAANSGKSAGSSPHRNGAEPPAPATPDAEALP